MASCIATTPSFHSFQLRWNYEMPPLRRRGISSALHICLVHLLCRDSSSSPPFGGVDCEAQRSKTGWL